MKIISFLGPTDYKMTTYCLEGKCYETRFFPAAVAHFIKPDKLLICATPFVQEHQNLVDLCIELDQAEIDSEIIPIRMVTVKMIYGSFSMP